MATIFQMVSARKTPTNSHTVSNKFMASNFLIIYSNARIHYVTGGRLKYK